MNIYTVVSEPLTYYERISSEIGGPLVDYVIAEIVAAPSRSAARWIAYRANDGQEGVRFLPRFSVRLIRKDSHLPAGIITGEAYEYLWAWGITRPWTVPEATLIENWLAVWAEATYDE